MASLDVEKGSKLVFFLLIHSQFDEQLGLVCNFDLAWFSAVDENSFHFQMLERVQATFSYLVTIWLRASSMSN